MSRKPSVLDPLRNRVRRAQLIMGLGFLSLVLGVFFFAGLATKIGGTLQDSPLIAVVITSVLVRLWVLAILPGLSYAAARVFELRPWTTAIGGAATGEIFLLALDAITPGLGALIESPLVLVIRAISLAGGIALTGFAVKKGRAAAAAAQERALAAAQAKKAEYDAFVRASERVAESNDKSSAA